MCACHGTVNGLKILKSGEYSLINQLDDVEKPKNNKDDLEDHADVVNPLRWGSRMSYVGLWNKNGNGGLCERMVQVRSECSGIWECVCSSVKLE